MDTSELLRRARLIEIKTRGAVNSGLSGGYRSAFRGRGMSLSEVREYRAGDDVRDLDWNVTARTGRAHVKVYEEERELTVMLLVDVSGSMLFGLRGGSLFSLAAEISASIALSATRAGDKVGLLLFGDGVRGYVPPGKGRGHAMTVLRRMLEAAPGSGQGAQGGSTNLEAGLEYLLRVRRRRCICFVVSDFLSQAPWQRTLRQAAHRHDVVAIRLEDERLGSLTNVGLLSVRDAENGREMVVDTSSRRVRTDYATAWQTFCQQTDEALRRGGVDQVVIRTGEDYLRALSALMNRRIARRA